jgi:Ran GTPase-activating protein (RanGAP) involved in mRNA processing and transport
MSIGGCKLLAKALETNNTVTSLNLKNCYIRRFGAEFIAKMLVKNNTLKILNLDNNSVRNEGVEGK